MTDFLKDFKTKEISEWINEAVVFFIKPRQVIKQIIAKKPEALLRQFIFFFLINTTSYLFLTLGTSVNEWVKPAVINIFITIPIFILFYIGTKFFKGKNYAKEILIYVLAIHFLVTPLTIIVYATFLATENYTYKYLADIISGIALLYLIFFIGFAVEDDRKKAFRITITCYLVINLFYFSFERINVDPYSTNNLSENDPIYQEYAMLVKPLKYKEKIPTTRFIMIYANKIHTFFGTQDIVTEYSSRGEDELNALYIKSVTENISHIEKVSEKLQFQRNKDISIVWLEYFKDIKFEAEFKIKDTLQIKELGLKQYDSTSFGEMGMKTYLMGTDIGKMMKNQIPLKWYNNSIVQNHTNSTIGTEIANIIVFVLGQSLDYLVGDIILKEGEPKPYTDTFLDLE